jgi:hypothetical protein
MHVVVGLDDQGSGPRWSDGAEAVANAMTDAGGMLFMDIRV